MELEQMQELSQKIEVGRQNDMLGGGFKYLFLFTPIHGEMI